MKNKPYFSFSISLLTILNLLFIVYYVILSVYGRLHFDDFTALVLYGDYSVLGNVLRVYSETSGRFVYYALNTIVYHIILSGVSYHIFPILYWMIGVSITYYVVSKLLNNYNRFELLQYVLLFYNLYILTAVDFAVFYWIIAIFYYLLPPIALCFFYLLNKKTLSIFNWIIIIVLSIALGGGLESFTPIILIALFINGLIYLSRYNWNLKEAYKDKRVQNLTIAAFIVLACFIIVVAAPGNYTRLYYRAPDEDFMRPGSILGWIKAISQAIIIFFYFQSFYLFYYAILFLISIYVGSRFKDYYQPSKNSIYYIIGFYALFVLFSVIPSAFLYAGFGIQRLYIPMVYYLMVFICLIGYVIGANYSLKEGIIRNLISAFSIFLIVIMVFNYINDIPVAKAFARSFDERCEIFENSTNLTEKDTLYLDPIASSKVPDVKYNVCKIFGKETPKPRLYYEADIDLEIYRRRVSEYFNLKCKFDYKDKQ